MWRATVLTLFPEMFPGPLGLSLAGKALAAGLWSLDALDIRAHATDKHRTVDDTPAGGGPGMVMKADVLARAIDAAARRRPRPRLLMIAARRAADPGAGRGAAARAAACIVVCGRFEGVDERVIAARGLEEVSVGDYVLSGGEIAAMALLDACVRLLPGVMGKEASGAEESFADGLLEYPQYTRPQVFEGDADPRGADRRRPRQGPGLAPRRGRAADPRAPAGPVGGPSRSGPTSPRKVRRRRDKPPLCRKSPPDPDISPRSRSRGGAQPTEISP